jgi:SAM-dependent methyltransferase
MRHVQAVQADYDTRSPRWAHVYEGATFHDVVLQERMAIALGMLGRRDRGTSGLAFDVGCGAGQLLEALHLEGAPVAGVDVSWQQVTLSRERVPAAVFVVQADGEQLPFADATVATLTALGLLEYLPSLHDGLAEFARVTMRGAHIVVSMPNPLRLAYLCDPIGVVLGRVRKTRPGYRRTYRSARALAAELQACGFDVIELRGHGLGRFTFGGRPILGDAKSVRLSALLQARLPDAALRLFGANLVAIARRA